MDEKKLYEVAYIVGLGPKWGSKVVSAKNSDEAMAKVREMGLDARSAWTFVYSED